MQEKKPRTTTVSSRYSLGEAASRFEGSERDVVSETGAVGKLCPGMGRPEWDAVSARGPLGKAHPILSRNYGTQFPFRIEEGALPAVDTGSAPLA